MSEKSFGEGKPESRESAPNVSFVPINAQKGGPYYTRDAIKSVKKSGHTLAGSKELETMRLWLNDNAKSAVADTWREVKGVIFPQAEVTEGVSHVVWVLWWNKEEKAFLKSEWVITAKNDRPAVGYGIAIAG